MPAAGGAPRLPEPVGVLPSGRVLLVEYESLVVEYAGKDQSIAFVGNACKNVPTLINDTCVNYATKL